MLCVWLYLSIRNLVFSVVVCPCSCIFFFGFFFFFSSRRRHTRSLCDWSSDVCSSDLLRAGRRSSCVPACRPSSLLLPGPLVQILGHHRTPGHPVVVPFHSPGIEMVRDALRSEGIRQRSEERRVGKECRSRWEPERDKN